MVRVNRADPPSDAQPPTTDSRPTVRLYPRAMAIPEPMLSTRAATWPAQGDWIMEPKWDGFRLLVEIDQHARIRA